jgi:Zn-dependent peptidase ImmA (M78 family)
MGETFDHIKKMEDRFIELYIDGFRPPVILDKISEEFNISIHVLYKRLHPVKDLKKRAEVRAKMSKADRIK